MNLREMLRDAQLRRQLRLLDRPIGYVGAFIPNLGDLELLRIHQEWFSDLDLVPVRAGVMRALARESGPKQAWYVLGGGTLVNSPRPAERAEEAVIYGVRCAGTVGVGVRHPMFWSAIPGFRQTLTDWGRLLADAEVTVRGPLSAELLSPVLGREPEVVGDPALDRWPTSVSPVKATNDESEGLLVLPVFAPGRWWDHSDDEIRNVEHAVVERALVLGWRVTIAAVHADDMPAVQQLAARSPRATVIESPVRSFAALRDIAGRHSVSLASRLHAAVFSVGAGTPCVMLCYQPKVLDFALSVGLDHWTLRGQAIRADAVWARLCDATSDPDSYLDRAYAAASSLRPRREAAIGRIRALVGEALA